MFWQYNNRDLKDEDIPQNAVGFIYIIESKTNGRKYIGRKLLTSSIRKPTIKNQTRKKLIIKESAWKTYYGSSKEIKELIKIYGKDDFIRTIISFYSSKSALAYFETKLIFTTDALLKDEYINKWCTVMINGKNLKDYSINS